MQKLSYVQQVRRSVKQRDKMLTRLANLPDGAEEQFWTEWGKYYQQSLDDLPLVEYRDRLQLVWRHARNAHQNGSAADMALHWWVSNLQGSRTGRPRNILLVRSGKLHLNLALLPLALAIGVTERSSKMAICPNPECRCFFLKERISDRFCGRPICANYGQREKKKKWWTEHGNQWRAARERRKRRK
jgi:hypothetical protein